MAGLELTALGDAGLDLRRLLPGTRGRPRGRATQFRTIARYSLETIGVGLKSTADTQDVPLGLRAHTAAL